MARQRAAHNMSDPVQIQWIILIGTAVNGVAAYFAFKAHKEIKKTNDVLFSVKTTDLMNRAMKSAKAEGVSEQKETQAKEDARD